MLNKLILFSLSIVIMQSSEAGNPASIAGKTYSAEISASCKAMSDGMCMLYTYCILDFKKDSVNMYYITKASCTNKSKEAGYANNTKEKLVSYKWKMNENTLIIEGFEAFAPFTLKGNRLTGTKEVNHKKEELEFKEGIE